MEDVLVIYHGSPQIVALPEYGKGNPHNDYGLGFYCTQDIELAKEWACANSQQGGFANQYKLNIAHLDIFNFNERSSLEWLAVLARHRVVTLRTPLMREAAAWLIANHYVNVSLHDVIIGYRADDAYFSYVRAFLSNQISLGQLERAMRLGSLGEQIVLKGRHAFESVSFVEAHEVSALEYYPKRSQRSLEAQRSFNAILEGGFEEDGVYIRDLMRGEHEGV